MRTDVFLIQKSLRKEVSGHNMWRHTITLFFTYSLTTVEFTRNFFPKSYLYCKQEKNMLKRVFWTRNYIIWKTICSRKNLFKEEATVHSFGKFPRKRQHSFLKVLYSDKLSRAGQIFHVWPYLNSLITIKLPFYQQEHLQIFPTSLVK